MTMENTNVTMSQNEQSVSFMEFIRSEFGWLVINLKLQNWFKKSDLTVALRQTYTRFAQQHPEWVACLFDEHFVENGVSMIVEQHLKNGSQIDPGELATVWDKQLGPARDSIRQHRIAELTPIAAEFVTSLQAELRAMA